MRITKKYHRLYVCLALTAFLSATGPAHAESARQLCESPLFQHWKQQQSERLWNPDIHTEKAEQAGMVFSYNCFTFEEIDDFFDAHKDRIENAHFYPILKNDAHENLSAEKDDDC